MSKRTLGKVYQISDLVQWYENDELVISPNYQRNSVWNENAKAYLIDTIIRGLAIPPIFLRQKSDVSTKKTIKEIIDGQQRVRAIVSYVLDESFPIKKAHNPEYAGLRYSDLDDETKANILNYEILAEVVTDPDEYVVYDMFSRLNSNNVALNAQELRNAKHTGEFKTFINSIATKHRSFLSSYSIFSDKQFSRMDDCLFFSSICDLLLNGIVREAPKTIDKLYALKDGNFPEKDLLETQINKLFDVIKTLFNPLDQNIGPFSNKNYFYTLIALLAHQLYGLADADYCRVSMFSSESVTDNIVELRERIINFIRDFEMSDSLEPEVSKEFEEFKKGHQTKSTDKKRRQDRVSFLNDRICGANHVA